MNRFKTKVFIIGLCLSFVLFGVNYILLPVRQLIKAPLVQNSSETITLNQSTSAKKFANSLFEKKLIKSPTLFEAIIRFQGLSRQLQVGVYDILPGDTSIDLLNKVTSGDVKTVVFRIHEGENSFALESRIKSEQWLTDKTNIFEPFSHEKSNVDGLFFADTYQIPANSSVQVVLNQARNKLQTELNDIWNNRSTDLPYKSPYELLTAASIIEKEAALPQERALISGVIINRLNKSMRLQMDPTVIYALGKDHKGALSKEDLDIDSPYNTYRYRGLPPGPIAMVSHEALYAAAHPKRSDFIYFVAKGDGSHQFSRTYQEQRQAIKQYIRNKS